MDWQSFFTVHKDLPREGPGCASDVDWAMSLAALSPDAVICDAGSGPGGDIDDLLRHVPQGRVVAVENHSGFVAEARARFAHEPRVRVSQADMADLDRHAEVPFDLIWCAGALYFLGLEAGLSRFASALGPSGVVAFSEPCAFVDRPETEARAFFDDYPLRTPAEICAATGRQGYSVLGHRRVPDAAWENYYTPLCARIDALRPGAGPELTEMLDLCAEEARQWRRVRDEVGYLLVVARMPG